MDTKWGFEHSYAALPARFFRPVQPTPVRAPRLLRVNHALADDLGMSHILGMPESPVAPDKLAQLFAGNRLPADAHPIATAYAGHQFGGFSPQLGDGRAILIGEWLDPTGQRWDIQLKGAGQTPFSRSGDGRSPLGPVLREYLVSEAMAALGVPTTRALAAVASGEPVYRDTVLPGGVLCRVARSHLRVGTFEFFAARGDVEGIQLLADHVIARHYPEVQSAPQPYLALLDAVIARQAALIAHWMSLGFIHGVMNTDNMSVAGDTIDYGPCAFMDGYDPDQVFSSIDTGGRYAYQRQPVLAQWNLARFAECLLPLLQGDDNTRIQQATQAIDAFTGHYQQAWRTRMAAKLGIRDAQADDEPLINDLLQLMTAQQADFTQVFRSLADALPGVDQGAAGALLGQSVAWQNWWARWQQRLAAQGDAEPVVYQRLQATNPAVIPRNHRMEDMIAQAINAQDFSLFEQLADRLQNPFVEQPGDSDLLGPPAPDQRVCKTFCGT